MAKVVVVRVVDEGAWSCSIRALRIEVLASRLAPVQSYSDTDGGVAMLGVEGGGAGHEIFLKASDAEDAANDGEDVGYHVENPLENHLLVYCMCK